MLETRLQIPEPHAAQEAIKAEARRFNVVDCGRRWGKSTMGEELAIAPALDSFPVGWFAPNYKYLMEVWRDLVRILEPVATRIAASEHRIELLTGGLIEMWTLTDTNAGRSRKYKRVILDEAAMVANLGEIWRAAIRPTLADYRGDAWLLSTPKGRNFFWECYQKGQDPHETEWKSWQMPTTSNPFISAEEIAAVKQETPERIFAQEYEAQFLEDAGGVFRRVMDAATATEQSAATADHQYVIGVDWGRLNDFTVICVMDATTRELVYIDRFNKVEYSVQSARLQAICEKFKPDAVIAETNSIGDPIIDRLRKDYDMPVRGFTTTNATKASAIDALSLAFERNDIKILNDPVLIGELQAYEATRLPSGLMRYGAPEGMHDDCVMSLALGWYGTGRNDSFFFV